MVDLEVIFETARRKNGVGEDEVEDYEVCCVRWRRWREGVRVEAQLVEDVRPIDFN